MDDLVQDLFLRLSPELVEEVFFRLPPADPACLVHASAVCKPWRRILADAGFRRHYREFHGTPPVLGHLQQGSRLMGKGPRLLPTSALFPAQPDLPGWLAMDCRHGHALLAQIGEKCLLMVLDPVTVHRRLVASPSNYPTVSFNAAVLCAAQGCDHHDCQGGHFHLAVLSAIPPQRVTCGWMYSSETRVWTELTSLHHPNDKCPYGLGAPSVLVGDALYFDIGGIVECQLGTLRLSMFKKLIAGKGCLTTVQDCRLGFIAVVDVTNLTLWSMETGPEGAMGWAKLRVVDLRTLLLDGAPWIPAPSDGIIGVAEGTQIIYVCTSARIYMVDLKSGGVRKLSGLSRRVIPYMRFYIPAMEATSTGQGQ